MRLLLWDIDGSLLKARWAGRNSSVAALSPCASDLLLKDFADLQGRIELFWEVHGILPDVPAPAE